MMILRWFFVISFALPNVFAQPEKGKGSFKRPAFCTKPLDHGPCRANVTYWYFHEKHHECKLFNYGGCGGNRNRFWTEKRCYYRCAAPGRQKILCSVYPDPKPCNSTFQAWYFSKKDNACHRLPRGMCTSTINRFMWCEKCMNRCSAENSRAACRREYQRIKEEENTIKQAQTPAVVAPGGAAIGTSPGLPSSGAGSPAPTSPPEVATQVKPENVLGPPAQLPSTPLPLPPAPAPAAAGRTESGTSRHENVEAMSGTTGAVPGVGGPANTLPNQAQQIGAFPGGSQGLSPTIGDSGPLSETNGLEEGSSRHLSPVAVTHKEEYGETAQGIRSGPWLS
nr:uncharacterized protein LOC119167920 [Rhipicephalus microplus]